MKLKSIFVIGTFAALASPILNAQTVIRISASNGHRGATQTAISNILASNWTFQGTGGSATAANVSVAINSNFGAWNGTYNGSPVIIKVSYSGALAGIAAAASTPQVDQRYVFSNGTGSGSVLDPTSQAAVLNVDYELAPADFGFSTNFQSTSPFRGVVSRCDLRESNSGKRRGFRPRPLRKPRVPRGPCEHHHPAGPVALYQRVPPAILVYREFRRCGQDRLYAIGRNTDAGQRYGAYAEIGLGTSTLVKVWSQTTAPVPPATQPVSTVVGQNTSFPGIPFGGTVTSHRPWPAETFSGISSPEGSGGYPSGQTLAPTLTRVLGVDAYKGVVDGEASFPDATAGYYIGYLTPNDALTRVLGVGTPAQTPLADGTGNEASRGVALSYNGVKLHDAVNGSGATVNVANIQNGKYTAWLYNRIVKSSAFQALPNSNLKKSFSNDLRDDIRNSTATVGGGLKIGPSNGFNVERLTDGGLVTPL